MDLEKKASPRHSMELAALDPSARVRQLADYGAQVDVDPNVPPRRYYRSGLEMVRMANVYLSEGSHENAYILYMKFMTLFLEKIRKHPEYASVPAQVKTVNSAKLKEVMPKAERLKQKLLEQYTIEYKQYEANAEKRRLAAEERRKQETADAELAQRLQDSEGRDKTRVVPHLVNTDMWAVAPSAPPVDDILYPDDFATEPPSAPEQLYKPVPPLIPPRPKQVPQEKPPAEEKPVKPSSEEKEKPSEKPVRPPSELKPSEEKPVRPPSDLKPSEEKPVRPASELKPSEKSVPEEKPVVVDRPLAPLSAGLRLRPVRVPAGAIEGFLRLAAPCTNKNMEMCGVLTGVLERDQLKITHVVVPKQTGTPDSCITHDEEDIFLYQDQHNLITLGWIHTHPTQTAFLSSVDLHTQCAYQLMMPEAIAIVCAPTYKQTGYFALTDHGMPIITKCRGTGFHPHPSDRPLFYTVKHMKLEDSTPVEIVDLRR